MQSGDRTNTVTGNDPFKVPFCDGLGVPLHSPGSGITGSVATDVTTISHSSSLPADHTIFLCAYDHGLKAPVRIEKVGFVDFEY